MFAPTAIESFFNGTNAKRHNFPSSEYESLPNCEPDTNSIDTSSHQSRTRESSEDFSDSLELDDYMSYARGNVYHDEKFEADPTSSMPKDFAMFRLQYILAYIGIMLADGLQGV